MMATAILTSKTQNESTAPVSEVDQERWLDLLLEISCKTGASLDLLARLSRSATEDDFAKANIWADKMAFLVRGCKNWR